MRGRPKKQSGVYYRHQVKLDDETFERIIWARRPDEPLGSVVQRLIAEADYLKKQMNYCRQ